MLRLFTEQEANARAFRALTRFLELLDEWAPATERSARAALDPLALSFQLKLLWLSGYLPHVKSCAECGAEQGLVGYSPRAGGAVCATCRDETTLTLAPEGLTGIEALLRRPLAEAGNAGRAGGCQLVTRVSRRLPAADARGLTIGVRRFSAALITAQPTSSPRRAY